MMSQVPLLLTCMLFSKALSLTCYQCLPSSATGTCTNEQTVCPDQCLTATSTVYMNGTKQIDYSVKMCGAAEICVSGSLNTGQMKMSSNIKCCRTDLCNSETLPALPKQAPNGRMCYGCDADGCSAKVNCEGDEDRCISATGRNRVSMKGCVSRRLCALSASTSAPGFGSLNVQCCEGNLCNGAESFTLSFLLLLSVPLLSSVLCY